MIKKVLYLNKTTIYILMKKILLFIIAVSFTACVKEDDGYCNCGPGPESDEQLRILLVNSQNDNLLSENTNGYLPDSLFTFYMLSNNKVSNLTERYGNADFLVNLGNEGDFNKQIHLNYSWFLYSNNTKEGSYVIDYNDKYPNDTIYLKYNVTGNLKSDKIVEVKLNGKTKQTESIDDFTRKLIIVK